MRLPLGFCLVMFVVGSLHAQTTPAQKTAPLPFTQQLRKTVAFITMTCNDATRVEEAKGTGFWVSYPDERLGKDGSFTYLVTNRHVAECWDEHNKPLTVQAAKVRLNMKDGSSTETPLNPLPGNADWIYPSDEAVDLAVLDVGPNKDKVDFITVPVSAFVNQQSVFEGDKILFSGFFLQFPGIRRMQPIVREGVLAMVPDEDMITTTGKLGRVYLGDVHIFGGNSGSPVFVDLGGIRNGSLGSDMYYMLGVVSGMYYEDTDLQLQVTTTLKGTAHANSGIAMIVPVAALRLLLDDPRLKGKRDSTVARLQNQGKLPLTK